MTGSAERLVLPQWLLHAQRLWEVSEQGRRGDGALQAGDQRLDVTIQFRWFDHLECEANSATNGTSASSVYARCLSRQVRSSTASR